MWMGNCVFIERILIDWIDELVRRWQSLLLFNFGQNEIELRQRPLKPFDQFSLEQLGKIDIIDYSRSNGIARKKN